MMANIFAFIFLLSFFKTEISIAENGLSKLKGIVKTIRGKYDIIDCVDIHQQPALDNPLLKNHKIQMIHPQDLEPQSDTSKDFFVHRKWHEDIECPEGTVPIRRSNAADQEFMLKFKRASIHKNIPNHIIDDQIRREYAKGYLNEGVYYGTEFSVTQWNPHVESNELSMAQTWITGGPEDEPNSIEAGWVVYPGLTSDYETRLFTFWTTDGYLTGCYNLGCPQFIQTSDRIYPGMPLMPNSIYRGENHMITISISKLHENWYLKVNNEPVGYWPANIFPYLNVSANRITWGGEVVNTRSNGRHTTTQMGSGHHAQEQYSKAASFLNLKVLTKENSVIFERPGLVKPLVGPNNNCYSLLRVRYRDPTWGDHFFFGGPGYSPEECP